MSGTYKYIRKGVSKFTSVHRHVMMQTDHREDMANLVVHHIDGNKSNNDPSNLVWMTPSEHSRLHHLGINHFPCDGVHNANYRHGMCVNGQSKEYKRIHNKKSYYANREARLAKQNEYGKNHRDHKRWYDKMKYWKYMLSIAETSERKEFCQRKINYLEENAV